MAEKTGSNHSWKPVLGAKPDRLRLLGELLRLRRAALGYRHVPAFVEARDINTRMAGDIEHGRRDTYTFPTLEDIAAAYKVTYMSMMAVVWSDADELVPEEDAPPAPAELTPATRLAPAGEDTPPMSPERADAARRWYDPINKRRFDLLRDRGIIDPAGEQMFPGDPESARAWDSIGPFRMSVEDKVWALAELQRWAASRKGNSGEDATSA